MVHRMSYQWLQMRIAEEQERRNREAQLLDRLPRALDELSETLLECIELYNAAFGAESAELQIREAGVRVAVRQQVGEQWQQTAQVDIVIDLSLPGFQVEGSGETFQIEVGLLPSDKVFYRDREHDQYLTIDDLTRRILDHVLFPKLAT
jgi:hypothetical protein